MPEVETNQVIPEEVMGVMNEIFETKSVELKTSESKTETAKLYDAQANQRIPFWSGGVDIAHHYKPLSDDDYISYREKLDRADGDSSKVLDILSELWNALVTDVEGYEEPKPDNWKTLIDAGEKDFSISKYLAAAAYEVEKTKRGWKTSDVVSVLLDCYFNGEIVTTKHELKPKTLDLEKRYQKLLEKSWKEKGGRGFKGRNLVFVTDIAGIAALYDEIKISVSGYVNNDVPIWHKVAVVSYYLGKDIDEKK